MITKSICTVFTKSELLKIINGDYAQIKHWVGFNDYDILEDNEQIENLIGYYINSNRIVAKISFSYEIDVENNLVNFIVNEVKPYSLIDIKKRIILL
jgi:hypothetical protein